MNLALFDFDGTITTREMFPDFMRFAVTPRRLACGKVLLAPLVAGYRLGMVPGNAVRAAIVAFGFRGVPVEDIRRAGEAFASDIIAGALRANAMEKIRWHQTKGDRVVVVSGSLEAYLAPWCKQHGLELLCSRLAATSGVLNGRYLGMQCVGKEKARRIRERYDLDEYAAVYAYGDTHEDDEMLAMADHGYFRWRAMTAVP
ncbi:HAD family hydrolase [Pseudoxanthomonas sacheonensis]|uniref:HAD family hydrolase n=1 Tax=Pseudoxanthomonas sacheonensis TaxID=443615 RepID=UPI0013D7A581|nr:HAD family hydrolase [Pseudoxanthomonas sacheonensis]KAF1712933.1 HAD-IB family hydrolase [Pseudoxanthomonas sacheonensis]